MPTSLETIRRMKVEYTTSGADDATQKLVRFGRAHGDVGTLAEQSAVRQAKYEAALQRSMVVQAAMNAQMMMASEAMRQVNERQMQSIAANDNTARGQRDQGLAWVDIAAKVYLAKTAYDLTIASLGILGTVADTVFKGIYAGAAYLPNKFNQVWQEGIDKLGTYVALSDKAGTLGTDFYQRLVHGAAEAKTTTESLLAVVNNLNTALETKLGGSAFANQVNALQGGGSLQGQRGEIADVKSASTSEAQFAASAKLIQSAMDAGERLVALDLTKSLWGEEARKKLAENSDYIHQITTALNNVKEAQIIAQPEIDRAVGLKIALENANKTLNDIYAKNKGVASDWSATGIKVQEVWVGVVSGYANSLSWLDKNIDALQKWLGLYSEVSKQTPLNTLASQMQNPQNIKNAMAQAQRIDDTFDFKPPDHKAIDQATTSILQYVAATKLAASVVGLSAAETQKQTIQHQLDAAAIKDGLDPAVERLTAKYSLLVQQATDAAAALDEVNKRQAGINALAAAFKAGESGYKSAQDSNQAYIDATALAIKFHDQAGALKEAQVNATLLAAALKAGRSGESPEDFAKAKQAGALAAQLAGLDKTKDAYARAEDTVEKYILTTNAAAKSVGAGVAAQEKAKVIAQLTAAAQRDGVTDLKKYEQAWEDAGNRAGAAAQKFAEAKLNSDIKFDTNTAFLSDADKQIASILRQTYGDQWKNMMDGPIAGSLRFNNQLKEINTTVRDAASTIANGLVQGLLSGQSAAHALVGALDDVGKSLTRAGINNIIKNPTDPVGYIEAGIGFITQLFTGDQKKREAEHQAQLDAASRAQGYADTAALAGLDTNNLIGALKAFDIQANQQRAQEAKSGNQALAALESSLATQRQAIADKFVAQDIATAQAAADAKLAAEKAAQDASLQRMQQYQDRLFATLIDTNTLGGAVAALERQQEQERFAEIAAGGQQLTLLIATQEAEKLALYKKFNDQSVEAAKSALKQIQDAANASAKTITTYVAGLQGGAASTASPIDRMIAAQATFAQNLTLAQQGNADAQSSITQFFETARTATRDVFGSSEQYQTFLTNGISQLLNLPNVQTTTDPVVAAMRDVVTAINDAAADQLTRDQLAQLGLATNSTAEATRLQVINAAAWGQINAGHALNATTYNQAIVGNTAPLSTVATNTANTAQNVSSASASNDNLSEAQRALLASQNALAAQQVSYMDAQNALLTAIKGLNTTSKDQLALLNAQLSYTGAATISTFTGVSSARTDNPISNNNVLTALNKIVANTYATALNTYAVVQVNNDLKNLPHSPGTYAFGGYTGAGGVNEIAGLVHKGEFVFSQADIARLGGVQAVEAIRADVSATSNVVPFPVAATPQHFGGGNSDLVAEVRALRAEVKQLREENNRGHAGNANHIAGAVREGAAAAVGAQREHTAAIQSDARQARNNPKAA